MRASCSLTSRTTSAFSCTIYPKGEMIMPVILVATTNPGKLKEYQHLFAVVPGTHIVSPNDVETWREVAETGETLADNALLKARAMREALPLEAIAQGWWV